MGPFWSVASRAYVSRHRSLSYPQPRVIETLTPRIELVEKLEWSFERGVGQAVGHVGDVGVVPVANGTLLSLGGWRKIYFL